MAIQLGSAYGKVELDASGVVRGVKSATSNLQLLQQAGEKVGGALSNIGNKLTIGVTLPLLAAGAASIKYASDLNETKTKVEVIFGDMSKSILEWSETSAQALGQSKQQALDAASNFAIFGKAAGLANQELVDFAESNVQLASDLASFFNTSPEEAIMAIGAAYRGESEPIRRYGVLINEAALQQKALELGIISQLGPLTQQQKILAANALILDQTKDAQGDFARTSDGLANSSRILNAQFKDMLATLGQNLLPIALMVVKALNAMLESFNKLPPGAQKMILVFLGLLAIAGPLLSFFGSIITGITTISAALPTLTTLLSTIGPILTGSALPAIASVGAALAPLLLILLVISAVLVQFALAWKLNLFWIRDNVKLVVNTIKLLWQALTAFLRGDTEAAVEYLRQAWQGITDEIKRRFEALFGWFPAALNAFVNFLTNAFTNIRNFIVNAFSSPDWSQIGSYILMGIANGMLGGIPSLIAAAAQAVQAVLNTFDSGLQAQSPSKKMMQRGIWSGQGYMLGLMQSMNPDEVSRSLIRPLTSNNSQQQNITMQFSNGLTMREAHAMIEANNERLISMMTEYLRNG